MEAEFPDAGALGEALESLDDAIDIMEDTLDDIEWKQVVHIWLAKAANNIFFINFIDWKPWIIPDDRNEIILVERKDITGFLRIGDTEGLQILIKVDQVFAFF